MNSIMKANFLFLFFLFLTWLHELGAFLDDSRGSTSSMMFEDCPVILKTNHSNFCECTSEITCYELDAIPEFTSDGRVYRVIDLRRQQIKVIPQNAFFSLQVQKITLDFNPIGNRIREHALSGLEGFLQEVSISSCGITDLPRNLLSGMFQLRHIHLWNNAIKGIPLNFFDGASDLVEISMWGNHIKSLHRNTFARLYNLQRLDLDHNRINQLSSEHLRHLSNLQALHLGHNRVHALSADTFVPLKKLRVLNLDHNGLQFLYDGAFNGLGSLLSLSLDHNSINQPTKDIFSPLAKLNHLFLQHNQLANTLWTVHLYGLRSLLSLDLSSNRISELPDGMFHMTPSLRQLRLDGNFLSRVQHALFPLETRLLALSVLNNPLQCVCDMNWVTSLPGASVWGSCTNSSGHTKALLDPSAFADHC